jgi:hypothetical protein
MSSRITDQDRLYSSLDRQNRVQIRVPFEPLLLAALGQYNPLKSEHKPDLKEVERVRHMLASEFGISL